MTTALTIGLVLMAWTVLPLPLAVVVGRAMRAEGAAILTGDLPADAACGLDLTAV
jgi:hypothetical protein